jgi:beta-lactam-binding protein with PASTA domain
MRVKLQMMAALIATVAGCSAMAQKLTGSPVRRDGNFAMPDVTGMSRTQAEAALRAQGITGSISVEENHLCDDPKVVAPNVCTTAPAAGQATTATIPVVLYLRQKGTATVLPRRSGIG